ncbi:MAG TPA: prepilin-type N-terminal cleavage/methylation domain-containing protein [Longimicrobiales bacterium]|nr:prepilin-type N-terminal cleavage/methylation domain-containing protein [Longimicrobiales bacterium]
MRNREGFGIVEVVVAMVLLSIIVTTLAGLTFASARQSIVADNAMARQAVALQTVNRLATMPYANVLTSGGCTTTGVTNRAFETCITLSSAVNGVSIEVVTTPLQHDVPASTMRLIRAAPVTANPLCVGC